jgi:arabinose-5-phosphate isomerase
MVDYASIAKRVINIEAQALSILGENLPDDLGKFVDAVLRVDGRIVVSGIGKSGHIGRKIAATLASTGTPASFVHSTEASHGDLGMITDRDLCLLISNSGETMELRDIVAHTKRFNIPMAAISSNPESALMNAADYKLLLPKVKEACSIGMAPTTSTTMTLALGDALAVSLMETRGFDSASFRVFHPGGKLGAALATVGQIMHRSDTVPMVTPDTPMSEVLIEMTSKGFGVAAVVGECRTLNGIVTDGDLRRNMAGLMNKTAATVSTPKPIVVDQDLLASDALNIMNSKMISVLLVVDHQNKLSGILHIHDLLRVGVV